MNELEAGQKIVDGMKGMSLGFAQAANDLGALKVIFGVFMVMMLVIMAMFIYQVIITNKRMAKIEDAAEKTIEFFNPIGSRSIGREEAKAIVRENLTRTATMLKYGILKIRYENHLSPGSADERIIGIVNSEHNNRKSLLGRFLIQEKRLSFVCESEDNHTLIELMKEWVYEDKEKFTVSFMVQAVNSVIDGVKAKCQNKIDELPSNIM